MSMGRALAFCAALMLVAGCASRLAPSDCRVSDWSDRGYRDALKGLAARGETFSEGCAALGQTVDTASYAQGYEEGLDEFCSSDFAYEYGERGGSYRNTCPGALHSAFISGYEQGRLVGALERQLATLERQIDDLLYRLDDPSTGREHYYYVREQLRALQAEQQRVEQQLARLRR